MRIERITTNLLQGIYWESSLLETQRGFEENSAICLYPQLKEHTFIGFGGAFTEAAAYNWLGLPKQLRAEVMEACFGDSGLRYTLGRTHMNSCDFSLGNYACLDKPDGIFQMTRDREYLLPMIQTANAITGGKLQLLLSPWSPPAFMKTNGEMNHGGKLKPDYRELWAQCMARYVFEYRNAGIGVRFVSVQNEPDAVQTWDSCI